MVELVLSALNNLQSWVLPPLHSLAGYLELSVSLLLACKYLALWVSQEYAAHLSHFASTLTDRKEKPILYRRYVTLHGLVLAAAFAIAVVWIIISATRHSTASSNCVRRFFSDTSLQSQGQSLCEIFSWVDVGIMGGLWLLLAILQVRPDFHNHALADGLARVISSWSCLSMVLHNEGITSNTMH